MLYSVLILSFMFNTNNTSAFAIGSPPFAVIYAVLARISTIRPRFICCRHCLLGLFNRNKWNKVFTSVSMFSCVVVKSCQMWQKRDLSSLSFSFLYRKRKVLKFHFFWQLYIVRTAALEFRALLLLPGIVNISSHLNGILRISITYPI